MNMSLLELITPCNQGPLQGRGPLSEQLSAWMEGLKEGGCLAEGWGWVVVDVAGQFIHLHYISLCCWFGVSAVLPDYHHVVTCSGDRIWGGEGSVGLVRESPCFTK